jgi:hypothetical protein
MVRVQESARCLGIRKPALRQQAGEQCLTLGGCNQLGGYVYIRWEDPAFQKVLLKPIIDATDLCLQLGESSGD